MEGFLYKEISWLTSSLKQMKFLNPEWNYRLIKSLWTFENDKPDSNKGETLCKMNNQFYIYLIENNRKRTAVSNAWPT